MSFPRPTLAVSACLFCGDSVLLVERAQPPLAGLFSLPGGRVEYGETLEAAARREIREETGLDIPGLVFLCLHEVIDAGGGVHAVIAVHAGTIDTTAIPRAGDDAAAVLFATIPEIEKMDATGRTTAGLAGVARRALATR